MPQVLLYSKCRPQDSDVLPLARKHRRVFVGYPAFRAGTPETTQWRGINLRTLLADISDHEYDKLSLEPMERWYRAQVSANRRLAQSVAAGSIALIPRIEQGICYAGEVTGPFELVEHPAWADEYLALRRAQGLSDTPELAHIADVVQTWPIQKWRRILFTALPRWISYRLLSRNTIGTIEDQADRPGSALDTVRRLMQLPRQAQYAAMRGGQDLEEALLCWMTPTSFEHLVIDLLQLEAAPGIVWHQVGGSGDGGVDGLGVGPDGRLHGVVQCKLHYSGSVTELMRMISQTAHGRRVEVTVAILHGTPPALPADSEHMNLWNRVRIMELIRKHWHHLPRARALLPMG